MTVPYKPEGYSDVSPYLIVKGAKATLAFLEKAFGATPLRQYTDEAGRIRHAEARIGDSVVMIADWLPDWPPIEGHVHIYVANVDEAYARALAAGATSVQAPIQKDDPDKRGGVRDAGGTTWWLGTQLRRD